MGSFVSCYAQAVRSALRNIESLDNYGETAAKEVKVRHESFWSLRPVDYRDP